MSTKTALTKSRPPPSVAAPWGKPGMAGHPPSSGLRIPNQQELSGTALALPAVKQVVTFAHTFMVLEDEINKLQTEIDSRQKILTRLRLVDIPNAMSEAGTKYIELDSGDAVEVKNFITGNIKEENREKAHIWLRKNGFGSLIKHVVACAFGMGDDKQAITVMEWLTKKAVPFEQKESVNTNTLRAFVRERLEAGKALPPVIDYTSVPTATIKRHKSQE